MSWKEMSQKLPAPLRKNGLMLLGLAGILLIFLSDALFSSGKPSGRPQLQEQSSASSGSTAAQETRLLEQRLAELIHQVEGAGKTTVMLTFDTQEEQIYACDEQTQSSESENGQRASSRQTSHVLLDGDSRPLIETSYLPQVRGVAVVCEGAGDISVVNRVTDVVAVVLDLPTSRICVTKMN